MSDSPDNFADISILPRSLGLVDEAAEARERRDLIVAKSGARLIGIFADEAASVLEWREPTPLPRAPEAVLGVVSVRGRMLTVLDPRSLLGERRAGEELRPSFLIALRGDEQLALAVDSTERILEIFVDEIEAVQHGAELVRGIIQHGREIIAVLNIEEIFNAALYGAERRRQRS
ncbi:MAG: chemotaxis protein CheW [Pyrinomonadaceae bacterium]|nr:chemotaxis protein CheW [Pyrinomonadaceae bacterium]